MSLLTKCDVSNMTIPDHGKVIAIPLISTQERRVHPHFKKTIKNLSNGVTVDIYSTYNGDNNTAFQNYKPTGVIFEGTLTEYGKFELDMTDENIRMLGIFIKCTQYEIINEEYPNRDAYEASEALKEYENGNYAKAWELVNISTYDDNIYTNTLYGITPVHFTYIREDVYRKMFSKSLMVDVFDTIYWGEAHNLTLDEAYEKVPSIVKSMKEKMNEYDFMPFTIQRLIDHPSIYLESHQCVFGRASKNLVVDSMILKAIDIQTSKKDDIPDDYVIQALKDIILVEYIVNCYIYLQISFDRANYVSVEDYLNFYTYRANQFINEIHEDNQIKENSFDGYDDLIEKVSEFRSNKHVCDATYVHGGAVEQLEEKYGTIPSYLKDIITEQNCDDVLVFDLEKGEYSIHEDHDFMSKHRKFI